MPANDLRRALDDAERLDAAMENMGYSTRALPHLKAVLREVARLHGKAWWLDLAPISMGRHLREWRDRGFKVGNGVYERNADQIDAAIARSPEWRAAFKEQYGIDPKEIEL